MRKFVLLLLICCIYIMNTGISEETDISFEMPDQAKANSSYTPSSNDNVILLCENVAQIYGSGATFSDQTITINASGNYYLSGTFSGQILVNSADEEKVTLILNGASITSLDASPLLILSAGKNVTISLVENSTNILNCSFIQDVLGTDGAYDAALFSKADLKFKGEGELYISCSGGKGINCRDDIEMKGGSLFINATDDGVRGKDSVTISDGSAVILAGADGIRSNNEEKEDKGFITISGGNISVKAALDAIQAYNTLSVSGGEITLQSGGGASEGSKTRQNDMGMPHGPGGWGGGKGWDMDQRSATASEDADSTKGLKSATSLCISGGSITADSKDDAIHSDGSITITGGQMNLATGDDGIHADEALYIQGGNILITQSYEGIEAADLQISGGETRVYASDDGVNAAGGEKTATSGNLGGLGGGRGGMGMLSTSSGTFVMSGGYVLVNSDGDGIDVNGDSTMTGGLMIVYGPTNGGNGALDYDGVFNVTGGTLLATGSSGMAQAVTASDEAQMLAFTCGMPANTLLHIQDTLGNALLTFSSPKQYSCVVFASDSLSESTAYEVYAEGTYSTDGTDGYYTDGIYTPGTLLGSLTL